MKPITIKRAGYKHNGQEVWHWYGGVDLDTLKHMVKSGMLIRFQYHGTNNPFVEG